MALTCIFIRESRKLHIFFFFWNYIFKRQYCVSYDLCDKSRNLDIYIFIFTSFCWISCDSSTSCWFVNMWSRGWIFTAKGFWSSGMWCCRENTYATLAGGSNLFGGNWCNLVLLKMHEFYLAKTSLVNSQSSNRIFFKSISVGDWFNNMF